MTDYMICQNQDNHLLYALKHGRFWFWDKHQNKWVPSDFAAQQYAKTKAQAQMPNLAQEDWLGECFGILMDDYEVPDAVVSALRALPNKEETPCKANTTAPNAGAAATTAAPAAMPTAAETSTTSAGANSCHPAPCSPADASGAAATPSPSSAAAACSEETFDYSGLDAQTADKLRGITECVAELQSSYAWGMAYQVGRAHDLLCGDGACATVAQAQKRNNQHSEATFTAWCEYIGVPRRTAYNLLNAYSLICSATPDQQKNLQLAPAKLLYAAGKKDAPADLVQAVKSGDITTHKQYQELLAQLKSAEAARDAALAEGAGAAALPGLAGCLLGGWAAIMLREVILHG